MKIKLFNIRTRLPKVTYKIFSEAIHRGTLFLERLEEVFVKCDTETVKERQFYVRNGGKLNCKAMLLI